MPANRDAGYTQCMPEPTPPSDPLRGFLNRAAPTLRAVQNVISTNEQLRAARDTLIDRAADALRSTPASDIVEGTEIVSTNATTAREHAGAGADSAGPLPPGGSVHSASPPAPRWATSRGQHFTAHRVRRMAGAAVREALRPAPAPTSARVMLRRLHVGVAATVVLAALWWIAGRRHR